MDSTQSLYGKCRCCLKAGDHRDVLKEYYCDGIFEVYYDIFLECFNVSLSTSGGSSNLICVNCIQRLRDANDFRKMVVEAEKQLQSVKDPADEVKQEDLELELESDDDDGDIDDNDFMDSENKDFGPDNDDTLARDEARLMARFTNLRALPSRKTLHEVCPEYVMHLDVLRGKEICSTDIEALLNQDAKLKMKVKSRQDSVTEKVAYSHNAQLILEYSNATAFKGKSRVGLPCYFCKNIFENIEELRTHQKEHKLTDVMKSLNTLNPYNLVINVDVTDLMCTLCDNSFNNLKEFKTHLEAKHDKKFYTKFEDRVIPFKVPMDNNYICQICDLKFESFGSIETHMNRHFSNYICDECGTGFVTGFRLKMHIKSMHVEGTYHCETCEKIFPSHKKLKNHVVSVHKMVKRFKCTKCSERFKDYVKRRQHLVQVHGQAKFDYKCSVCEKSYTKRYVLYQHMKRDHLEELHFECEVCCHKFFDRRDLESHMVKHNVARIFECSVCKKAYARRKALREHMRKHNRLACAVCGQAFVQNCSLKWHMKTRHPECKLK
ncbi:PR domain zinc finger protein 5-like isoform X2 [Leguminivora glycinivorella]|uniref:PR domain zinc finger protein 5-like isoform X2 n=1 Tax=Leguminivora glycinivorella TaxID=1035111 RepID=UPI00200DA52D|nr:PR domain zinc finger protein 5-like isoform X2 [Leguminivora glycinivorella]